MDTDYRILNVNKYVEEVEAKTREEMIGKKCYELYNLSKPCDGCVVSKTIEDGIPNEEVILGASGRYWLQRAYPVKGDDDE